MAYKAQKYYNYDKKTSVAYSTGVDMTIATSEKEQKIVKDSMLRRTKSLYIISNYTWNWYAEMVSLMITNIYKKELNVTKSVQKYGGTTEGIGYSFGELQKSVKAVVREPDARSRDGMADWVRRREGLRRTVTFNSFKLYSLLYGDVLALGRRRARVKIINMIQWIERKMANGTLFADVDPTDGDAITRFAFAISRKKIRTATSPLLPKWKKWDEPKQEKLRRELAKKEKFISRKFMHDIKTNIANRRKQ